MAGAVTGRWDPHNSAGAGATLCLGRDLFELIPDNEPPVVFHWVPIISSTITYGMDPYRFFFDCKAKVGLSIPW